MRRRHLNGQQSGPSQRSILDKAASLDINQLRHPTEFSRLVLALTAAFVTVGLVVLAIVLVFGTEQVAPLGAAVLLPAVLFLGSITMILWLTVLTTRARMLGNSLLVSDESLPYMQQVVDHVRGRVGYFRRVDIYISDAQDDPVRLLKFLGIRVLILKSSAVADLQAEERRPELEFFLGSIFGSLTARHQHFILLRILLELETRLKVLNIFLAPYYRATVYTGDQIGVACCGSVPAAIAMMNRLLVGNELSKSVQLDGILSQAVQVRKRWAPRWTQLFVTTPNLTNRYLNLVAFTAVKFPRETDSYLSSREAPTRELTAALGAVSLRWKAPRPRRALLVSAATLTTAAILVLGAVAMTQWRDRILEAVAPSPVPGTTPLVEPMPGPTPITTDIEASPARLLESIPDGVEPCQEAVVSPGIGQGAIGGLQCSPIYLDSFDYIQYRELSDMQSAYYSTIPSSLPGTDCRVGPSGVEFSTNNYGIIELSCYQEQAGEIVFVWTYASDEYPTDVHLLGIARSSDLGYSQMYEEWVLVISGGS